MLQRQFEIRVEASSEDTTDIVSRFMTAFEETSGDRPTNLVPGHVMVACHGENFGGGEFKTSDDDTLITRAAFIVESDEFPLDALPHEIIDYTIKFLEKAGVEIPLEYQFPLETKEHSRLFDGKEVKDPIIMSALEPILV